MKCQTVCEKGVLPHTHTHTHALLQTKDMPACIDMSAMFSNMHNNNTNTSPSNRFVYQKTSLKIELYKMQLKNQALNRFDLAFLLFFFWIFKAKELDAGRLSFEHIKCHNVGIILNTFAQKQCN